ncbi:MAG TPA: hypothetical protein VMB50_03350 [Myxococcales bacterium]|nr:hypothetical protein [Myxococcales bacterium]
MRRLEWVALGVLALAACSQGNGGSSSSGSGSSTSSGAASSGTTGAHGASSSGGSTSSAGSTGRASSGGSSAGATAGTSGSGGTSAAASTGGSTGGGSTGGSTGGAACGPGDVWVGETCVTTDCAQASLEQPCALGDGGIGACWLGLCQFFDFANDPNNCGYPGVVCPAPATCAGGQCVVDGGVFGCAPDAGCPTGETCAPNANSCIPASCDGGTGVCTLASGGYGLCCGSACADVFGADTANCGACGRSCGDGSICEYGSCASVVSCGAATNFGLCQLDAGEYGTCCSGSCVNTQSDDANCGNCGIACPTGSSCQGYCQTDAGVFASCGGATCPPGTTCTGDFQCLPPCRADSEGLTCGTDAGSYGICCSGTCVDEVASATNCGGCGIACGAGQVCQDGTCLAEATCSPNAPCPLADGQIGTCCNGSCVDTLSDSLNCYGCGRGCRAGASCVTGVGCELDGGTAQGFCAQDQDCPAGLICVQEWCVPPSCTETNGGSYCPRDAGGSLTVGLCCGDCIDFSSDPLNCGNCGWACPAGSTCQDYQCQQSCSASAACPAGYACDNGSYCTPVDCSVSADNEACSLGPGTFGRCCGGACVDTNSDTGNCGYCGLACPTGFCSYGFCYESQPPSACAMSCAPGTVCMGSQCIGSICGGNSTCLARDGAQGLCCDDGSCADLLSDSANCGECGITCPAGQTCQAGACSGSPACGPGHFDAYCNLDGGTSYLCCPGTGCTDSSSDAQNCGGCGNACAAGQSCTAGQCG